MFVSRGGKFSFLPPPMRGVGGVLQDPNPEKFRNFDEKAVGKNQKAVGKTKKAVGKPKKLLEKLFLKKAVEFSR